MAFQPPSLQTNPSQASAATLALNKGMLLRFKKEIPQAIEVIEKAQKLFEKENILLGVIYTKIELAWLYGNAGEKARSEKLFREAETELIELKGDQASQEAYARWLHYRGLLLYQTEDYGPAIKEFKKALECAHPKGLESAKIYDSLGVHYERTGDFHRAVRFLKMALEIKREIGFPLHEEAITCQILGRLYLLYEDYDLALAYLERSFEISNEVKDEKRKASLKNEMIRLFLRCGREDEARNLIKETQQSCQAKHLKIQYSMACFYEAYAYYKHAQYQVAANIIEKEVYPVFKRQHYKKGLALAKRLDAWLQYGLNSENTTEPISLFGEAIELFRLDNMIDEVAKSHFELGKFYAEIKNDELALASLLDALRLSEENGLFYLLPYIEDEIFRTHESKWAEVVNKRAKHERVFEKKHSLVDALDEMIQSHPGKYQEHNSSHLMSLIRVSQVISAERDLDKLIHLVCLEVEKALQASQCTVFIYDIENNQVWSKRLNGTHPFEIRFPAHQGLVGYVIKTGESLNIANAAEDPRFNETVDRSSVLPTSNMVCLPIRSNKGGVIGAIQVINKKEGARFTQADEDLLSAIVASAGIALENATLYQELKWSFESFVKTLSSTIDARDPITAGHSERVMEYSILLGQEINLGQDEMEALKYAALLHDIGKIGVKEEVLVKQGRLTEKEYRHIQQHVSYTHQILSNIRFERHLSCVPDIAAAHHEKMDGTGYHQGLKGDQIPLGGRVLAVADVFDAITSRRPYRNRMPFHRALSILNEGIHHHFDADVVAMFMKVSLKKIGHVLCMDSNLPVTPEDVDRVIKVLPASMSIEAYLALTEQKKAPSKTELNILEHFNQLYHFSEISDME
jgi:HD-GYP domain-containing protein (c-di-GMP phosphodiesterase class II)/tetratricopeptide (TPR) repeat protein